MDVMPYLTVSGAEVSDEAWPFVFHLNEMHRRWRFYRRNLRLVRCIDPKTGELALRFSELVTNPELADSEEGSFARETLGRFEHDEFFHFSAHLSNALAAVSHGAYLTRVEMLREVFEEGGEKWDYEVLPEGRQALNVTRYLIETEAAFTTMLNWDNELRQVGNGQWLLLWKAGNQRRGASKGGRKGAITRREKMAAPPEKVALLYKQFEEMGHDPRSIAAKVARRLEVSSDYVRRQRRAAEKQT
ncbi:hypothetical protein [Roseateles puraquae]|uniref:hypothetical protein n=2 Tax=Roseateles puraquae TaxID=431059 RepID=UPI0031E384D9